MVIESGASYKFTLGQVTRVTGNNIAQVSGTLNSSSAEQVGLGINMTYNQSLTASSVDQLINRTETALGSGTHSFVDYRVAGSSKFKVSTAGRATATAIDASAVYSAISTKTASHVVTATDHTLLFDCTVGALTATLPAAATNSGRMLTFKKIDSSVNTLTVDGNGTETIQALGAPATTQVITGQGETLTIQSNGTGWYVI